MAESKLSYIISRFSEAELQDFGIQLLNLPSRRDEVLVQVLALMQKGVQDNEAMYKAIYPNKAFSDKQMRNLRSDLYKRLEEYLVRLEMTDSPDRQLYLLRALNKRGPHARTLRLAEQACQAVKNGPIGLDQMDLISSLSEEKVASRLLLHERKSAGHLEMLQQSEKAFVAKILYQGIGYCENRRAYYGGNDSPPIFLWQPVIATVEAGLWDHSPLIRIYYSLYQLISQTDNHALLGPARELLTQFASNLMPDDALRAYNVVLNFCKVSLNKGYDWILEDLFEIYTEMMNLHLLELGGFFDRWHFKSIVLVGLRTGRLDWTEDFIKQKSKLLPPSFRVKMQSFALGATAFTRGEFTKAKQFMNDALSRSKDPFMALDIRSYLLRIYYETENFTGVESLLNSFRLYIRRHNHLPQKRLENYKEFVRFFRRFLTLTPGDQKQALKLYQEIRNSQQYACRDWLLNKMKATLKIPDLPVDKPGSVSA